MFLIVQQVFITDFIIEQYLDWFKLIESDWGIRWSHYDVAICDSKVQLKAISSFFHASLNWVSLNSALSFPWPVMSPSNPKMLMARGKGICYTTKKWKLDHRAAAKRSKYFSHCVIRENGMFGWAAEWPRLKEAKGAQTCMHAGTKLSNYHFLNRESVPNECCKATQHLDRDHKTYN